MTRSGIPPYVFARRFDSEKKNHPFDPRFLGRINPYTECAVNSEADYYEYLREHTYFMLCDELVAKQTKEIRETAQNDITWLRNQNAHLIKSCSDADNKLHRYKIACIVLAVALIVSIFVCMYIKSSAYNSGVRSGRSAGYASGLSDQKASDEARYSDAFAKGEKSGYQSGFSDGKDEGYREGYQAGSSSAVSRSSGTSTHTGTGSTRDTPIADTYIGNKKSKKFHLPTCSYLPDQNNQVTFDSRDDAIAAGYSPCGHCNP